MNQMTGTVLDGVIPAVVSRRTMLLGAAAGTLAACGPAEQQAASQPAAGDAAAETQTAAADGSCTPSDANNPGSIQNVDLK